MSRFALVLRYCNSSHMPTNYRRFIIVVAQARGGVTRLAECLADLWAGDKVTPSTNHRVLGVHIIALCGMGQAKLHVRRVGHRSICLNDRVKREETRRHSTQTLMVSSKIFSTAVTGDGDECT